jgi:transglutaminase-like putative cysteine protease
MYYSIHYVTRFQYSAAIRQSVMELRMQPITEGSQHCLTFSVLTHPRARVSEYRDFLGNMVHHFNIPSEHTQLTIVADALVHKSAPPELPDALGMETWRELDSLLEDGDYWDMLVPSTFARPSELLRELASELGVDRRRDPLTVLRNITEGIHRSFTYSPQTTTVDSPIDESLRNRKGVCQDFAHIMTALTRQLGIPCRYVSGYLFHRVEDQDRSAADATHAWVETLLPGLGWVGFDPTNNLIAGERHIRAAVGRDYDDVPPTRGVFQGDAQTELSVAVQVVPSEAPISQELPSAVIENQMAKEQNQYQQQQQQQQ